MLITIDKREKLPFTFSGKGFENITTEAAVLPVGDYSLPGLADMVSVERKSVDDLILCMTRERERFERELHRARGLDAFAVVIEASFEDLARGRYRSQMNPHAACQSVLAYTAKMSIPFLFAGNRAVAEYATAGFLRQYLAGCMGKLKAVEKAAQNGASKGKSIPSAAL